jgi:hypothetical protein
VSGGAAAHWLRLGLGLSLFGNQVCGVRDAAAKELVHSGRDAWHSVVEPGLRLFDGSPLEDTNNRLCVLLCSKEVSCSKVSWGNSPSSGCRRDLWDRSQCEACDPCAEFLA